MDSLLDALQEGRLIELPDNNKEHALQYLAHIIEANPSLPAGADVVGLIMHRENATNTALGKGWACPHARVAFEEDLMCVVGWSPAGVDYGAPDGIPVSIIAMYLVPDNQRNRYLREVSILAKALMADARTDELRAARELNEVRDLLLDLISSSKTIAGPDTRARMIQLQARSSATAIPIPDLAQLLIEPVSIVTGSGTKHLVLGQNRDLVESLDNAAGLVDGLANSGEFRHAGWRVVRRGAVSYQFGRVLYDCLAIEARNGNPKGGK